MAEAEVEVAKPTKRFTIKSEGADGLEMLFEQKTVAKGDKKGEKYWAPKDVTLDILKKAWGEANVLETFVNQRLNQFFIGLCRESTDDDGVFKEEDFIKYANELSLRGDSIPDMKNRITELAGEFAELDATDPKSMPEIIKIGKEMKRLNEAIKNKRRKTDEDKAAENEPAKVAA